VLHGWYMREGRPSATEEHADTDDFRVTLRDIYIAPGDTGFWQGAVRDTDDPWRPIAEDAVSRHEAFTVEVLYGDTEGSQRTITRFAILPRGEGGWGGAVGRHWSLDAPDPHPR